MKSHYTGLWLIVALSLVIFLIVAFADDIHIGSWSVKKAPFADRLLNEQTYKDSLSAVPVATELAAAAHTAPVARQDSMSSNLRI